MSDRKRIRRDNPVRTGPIRNYSKLYRGENSANGTSSRNGAPSEKPQRVASVGPLAEGVELAYSVIEKYIAEGRRTAEGLSNQPYATRVANDNLQDILERMLRFQGEILPLWIDTLANLVKIDPSQNGYATTSHASPAFNGAAKSDAMEVSIEVASIRPVQVSVQLKPNSETQSLVALGLSAVDSGKSAAAHISFVPDDTTGRVRVRIRVPDRHPSGTYAAVVVNRDSGEIRGTVSIRIAD
jgi:hypothetical protein